MTATLMDLFKSVTWLEVATAFRRILPDDHDGIKPMERIFYDMLRIKAEPSPEWLHLQWYTTDPDHNGDTETFVEVCCIDTDHPYANGRCDYAIGGSPWAGCLGMRVTDQARAEHADADIVAHCLRELTFYGFDDATIQAKLGSYEDSVDRDDEVLPAEQVFRELGLGDN